MELLQLVQTDPLAFAVLAGIVGLIVGSFLNVVIHRTPILLMRRWRRECEDITGQQTTASATEETFNLVIPRSRCPRCGHSITALENIPVLSYLWLRGKCSACGNPISIRYPSVEILSAVLSATVAWHLGFGIAAVSAIVLTWLLIALTFIDIDHQLLPDIMVLPFLWAGLLLNVFNIYTDLSSAVIGAMAGYLSLWLVFQLFKLITGKEGMGYGDFKLLALFGAWLGWQSLLLIVLLSSLLGALIGIGLIVFRGRDRAQPLPFGPYLAMAGWVALMWGDAIVSRYVQMLRI